MIKKIISSLLIVCMIMLVCPSSFLILAEGSCDEDPDSQECKIQQAISSSERIAKLNSQMAEAEKDLSAAQKLASSYYTEALGLQKDIDELQIKVDILTENINELQIRIDENTAKVDTINKRVLNRMESSQGTMHFNPLLDFILGSKGFADMLRRTYGVEAIMSKESSDREELIDTINQLSADKEELEVAKADLDASLEELINKQAEYMVMMNYYNKIAEETESRIEEIKNALENEKTNYKEILSMIDDISSLPTSEGFYAPIRGASISSGFPYYPAGFGGGVHLGIDYAVGYGTPVYAPANGVVLVAYYGCGVGYLGCTCGGDGRGNGVTYGGNQVSIMMSVYDKVYVVTFGHLSEVDVERYQVVSQGDMIGRVGSSGSSTGPHSHIELFYLGPGDMEDMQNVYLQTNYSSSWNCGWGAAALVNICDYNGYSYPCRLDPSDYFGGK